MSTIIALPGRKAHPEPHPDAAARQRQDRLAGAPPRTWMRHWRS